MGSTECSMLPFTEEAPVPLLTSMSVQDFHLLDVERKQVEQVAPSSPRPVPEQSIDNVEVEIGDVTASCSEASANTCASSHLRAFLRLFKQRSLRRLTAIPHISPARLSRRIKSAREMSANVKPLCPFDSESYLFKPSWRNFSLAELKQATNSFNNENLIGRGGYAEVYKGHLGDGQLVAIKRLTRGTTEERISIFLSEVGILVHVNHPNTAKLVGFGIEGGMHLIFKLSPHGSLAHMLNDDSKKNLSWRIRYKVALGAAEGLYYLHACCQRRIIHRDIKSANILLTEDFEPQF